ncbi:hypothetical protein [Methylorubrum aminovorans]|uniref:hypothetical protein n=1 Tax=Methylorubrum aminovorans TaxID=269069 RepID=UPI0024E14DF8|nr:hypothetical protein [Methylorubrum aminovorans]
MRHFPSRRWLMSQAHAQRPLALEETASPAPRLLRLEMPVGASSTRSSVGKPIVGGPAPRPSGSPARVIVDEFCWLGWVIG